MSRREVLTAELEYLVARLAEDPTAGGPSSLALWPPTTWPPAAPALLLPSPVLGRGVGGEGSLARGAALFPRRGAGQRQGRV